MLQKIFNKSKKKAGEGLPAIYFGRYSDNNKSLAKVEKWNEAETLFKEKKWLQSIAVFFEYLKDENIDNVSHIPEEGGGRFELVQGSKIIRGHYNEESLRAETALARMPQPGVPVMRRLLEMNFSLYYSRFSLNEDHIYMFFDSDTATANPSKLYYGLKELATKADKQDDLLVQDFTTLLPVDTEHVEAIPEAEKEIRFTYFKKWITGTLELIATVDADKYAGGIAYLLLALAYRIDYLIMPQGKLLLELEKIVAVYFKKDERPVTEKNGEMIEGFQKLADKDTSAFYPYLFRSVYTFSIVTPQPYKLIADAIHNANQNISWYKEARLPTVAAQISEYGFAYTQYSYSLPRPVTELFHLFMMINYGDYFKALGIATDYYNSETAQYNKEAIIAKIEEIEGRWQEKYPELQFKTADLKWDNAVQFNQSFTKEIESLGLETK